MAKVKAVVTYSPVEYVGTNCTLQSIIPSGKYKTVKSSYFKEISCGEQFDQNDERLVAHAARLIATKPDFLTESNVEWLIAYVFHLEELFKEVLHAGMGSDKIPEIAMEAVKSKRNVLYTIRLCVAASLLNKIVNGGYLEGNDDARRIEGIVKEGRYKHRWEDETFSDKVQKINDYFESGGFRSAMTRAYFKGAIVKFRVPEGSEFGLRFEDGTKLFSNNETLAIKLTEFPFGHYGDSYFDPNYKFYGAPFIGDRAHLPANQIAFVGNPYIPPSKDDEDAEVHPLSYMKFFVPHDWILSVCAFGDKGLVSHRIPDHKYRPEDTNSLNVEMTIPAFSGPYADDIRALASCLSFKDNGFLVRLTGKQITGKDMAGFIKSRKDTNKTPKIIESVHDCLKRPCLYIVDNASQWDAINRVAPAKSILIFSSEIECSKSIVLSYRDNGGDVFVVDSKVASKIQSDDPDAKTFKHASDNFEALLKISSFNLTSMSHINVAKVIKDELYSSNNYTEYLKSKEYMEEINKFVNEAMFEENRNLFR